MSKNFAKASDYPLHWPEGFPVMQRRQQSRFNTTLFQALENVKEELRKLAADSGKKLESVVISSNYSLSNTHPENPGVAVWFVWDGEQTCIPVDRYTKVEDNLQAIYHCISADRTKLRHGGLNLVKAAYRGYMALSHDSLKNWRDVLGSHQSATLADVKAIYQKRRKEYHPDHGGDPEMFHAVQSAWQQAQKELGA